MRRALRLLLVVLALGVGGCAAGGKSASAWSATVSVQGDAAILSVPLSDAQVQQQYHPHISLDGGPVVMMYAATYTFHRLRPGAHVVDVVIADANHNPIAGMSKSLTFAIQ